MRRGLRTSCSVALIAACVVLLAVRCGAGGGPPSPVPAAARGGPGFNSADVMFLQMMVSHQGQGVKLARTARGRPVRPEVATLAAAIETTQLAEIGDMAGRLRGWHRPPTTDPRSHEHDRHGGMPATTDAELKALARTPPDRFERAFLNLLIAHQDDAVQLARLETGKGEDAWTRRLARRVDASRSAQIDRMLTLLGTPAPKNHPRK
ncbi:DUF305 domain-containing protein [Actinomadura viridis]|uniref:DUF305 domain-containing protein n=1 Tax=Actinomadura viridis TaxID=58110 RepID=UPI0036C5A159